THWEAYHLCEDLVDLETEFQLWRSRHMRTVMRIIGFRRGTGGSSGVGFLKQALDLTFFPELFEVRTTIGPARARSADAPDWLALTPAPRLGDPRPVRACWRIFRG